MKNFEKYKWAQKIDKFGHKSDFDEIPEYVECIKVDYRLCSSGEEEIGNIYKTSELPKWVKGWTLNSFWSSYISYYKPSTKEAYEAQQKPKFEVGKWYNILKSGKQFRRCTQVKSDGFLYDWCVLEGEIAKLSPSDCIRTIDQVTEVPLSEIQQYLPDGHPDKFSPTILPNSATANKRVEELSYPDVIHIENKEDWDKVVQALKFSSYYDKSNKYYLIPKPGRNNFGGTSSKRSSYEGAAINSNYTIYEMNQLIFPPAAVKEWSVGTYLVITREGYCGHNECLKHYKKLPLGLVGKISNNYRGSTTAIENNPVGAYIFEKELAKWFATKEEAEVFSQQFLHQPVKSKEELLEEAKRRYPIGTRFNSISGSKQNLQVTGFHFRWMTGDLVIDNDSCSIPGTWIIYKSRSKQWAEIISVPEESKDVVDLKTYPLTPSECYEALTKTASNVLPGNNGRSFDLYIDKNWLTKALGPTEFTVKNKDEIDLYVDISQKFDSAMIECVNSFIKTEKNTQQSNKKGTFAPIKANFINVKQLKTN